MARIHELLGQLRASNPLLAAEIEREVDVLSQRRAFGLNFERHTPEAVELPGRKVRAGDKVRVQPSRGELPTAANRTLYRVVSIERRGDSREARIAPISNESEGAEAGDIQGTADVDDLVVVAEFRDPIYPGLASTGKVERGGDKPFHTVINAENFHALQTLLFTHRAKVDAIYIDPPYNTGARDWKYNNDYVEGDDLYRHSKWLAFIERRLLLAKELLNPDDSVLIVTIDEKEYLRLGLLLEQVFPAARITMISSVINSKGVARRGTFGRTDEYIYFVQQGASAPAPLPLPDEWKVVVDKRASSIQWVLLNRSGTNARRVDRPSMFYPVFIRNTSEGPVFHSVGEPIGDSDRADVDVPDGCVARWPIRSDGSEGRWQVGSAALRDLIQQGYVRLSKWRAEQTTIEYTPSGEQNKIKSGLFTVVGRRVDGSVIIDDSSYTPTFVPGSQWRVYSHNASGSGGVGMIRTLLHPRSFPFPKSLYAVEDTLRFFVANKPDAIVLDFFSGSGTTAHAVFRLNRQDDGRRRAILITNNEVSADEQLTFRRRGLRPGDLEWEQHGICDYITKPRIEAAVTGRTPSGQLIQGNYKYTDVFPVADGFEENVEFFTLTYEAPMRVQANREFARIAPFLWLRAGSRGRRIEALDCGWDVAEAYGVLADLDQTDAFLSALTENSFAATAYIVTDEDRLFEAIGRELPAGVEPVRMYQSYLSNFEIDAMRSVR